jgi:Immunity protein 9
MMKLKITSQIQVFKLEENIDYAKINDELRSYLIKITPNLNLGDMGDWSILFSMLYGQASCIGVFKRLTTYPSDKEKQVSITIPIPDLHQATYGLGKEHFHRLLEIKPEKFHVLEPNFADYSNLDDYVLASGKRGIDEAFKQGITVDGKKIRYAMSSE